MKVSKQQLKQIIKEEIQKELTEAEFDVARDLQVSGEKIEFMFKRMDFLLNYITRKVEPRIAKLEKAGMPRRGRKRQSRAMTDAEFDRALAELTPADEFVDPVDAALDELAPDWEALEAKAAAKKARDELMP